MAITALAARTCRCCGTPLTDAVSLRYRIGPKCRLGMTGEQLRAAMEQTRAERTPGYIPPDKPATATARRTNATARATVEQAQRPNICPDHGGIVGRCAGCRWEAEHPAARIIAAIQAQTYEERRADRIAVLRRRYAHVAPCRPDPATRPARRRTPARPAGPVQMELA